MTRIRVVSIEVELAPGEHLPAGFGDFLGQMTEPESRGVAGAVGAEPVVLGATQTASDPAVVPALVAEPPRQSTRPTPSPSRIVTAAKKAPPAAPGSRAARTEAIRAKLVAGVDKATIAKEFGITPEAVRLHEKKMSGTPAKPAAKDAPSRPTFRCQECGQRGYDPKRCDHCQEKRPK